jgi:type IV secretion system protein VirD4
LADLIFDPAIPPEGKTLLLLRQRVSRPIPELKELLEAIYAKGSSYGFGFPAQLAGNLKDIAEKQFSGFYGEAGNATSWLAIPSLARLVCGSGFRTRNLLSGKLDVFINLPLKVLQSSPQAARVILGALLNAVYEARGQNNGRILFLLDEVARLGYMGILETAPRYRPQVRHQPLPALPIARPAHPELGTAGPPGLVRCRLPAALLPYSGLRGG